MQRRAFLQYSAATAAVTATGSLSRPLAAALADPNGISQASPIYLAIGDDRFADGRDFIGAARCHGVTGALTGGDVTALWYRNLSVRWRQGPTPVAGMTGPDVLFCLAELARDVGMHLVFEVVHERLEGGGYHHHFSSSAQSAMLTSALNSAGNKFPAEIAAMMIAVATDPYPIAVPRRTAKATSLPVSWLMAPARKRNA